MEKLRQHVPDRIKLIAQGEIVAESLAEYLNRHPEMETRCSKNAELSFYTTDDTADFDRHAAYFYKEGIKSERVFL